MNDRPYEVIDKFGDVVSTYGTQDRLMHDLYFIYATHGKPALEGMSFMYTDEEETQHFLGYPTEQRFLDWCEDMKKLHNNVRLQGTDFIGLSEYLEFAEGLSVDWDTSDTPPTEIDFFRYTAFLMYDEQRIKGIGSAKIEALAEAFMKYKDMYGTPTTL